MITLINVKRLAATNNHGTRIKISADGEKSLTTGFDYSMDYDDNARAAVREFAVKNGLSGDYAGYIDSDGNGVYILEWAIDRIKLGA